MSCPANPLDCTTGLVSTAVGSVASSAWDQVCQAFANAAAQLLGAFGKAFVAIPPVNLGSGGVRKFHWRRQGTGKRGGLRIRCYRYRQRPGWTIHA